MQATNLRHPQEHKDFEILREQLGKPMNDYGLCELARLIMRYRDFPGAQNVKDMIVRLMQAWQLDKETLFAKTRAIHAAGTIYRRKKEVIEHWF